MMKDKNELAGFFDQVFADQFVAAFGHTNDKSKNGPLTFTIEEGEEIQAAASCDRLYQALKINDLAVQTSLQDQGLGSRLMEQIKDYARKEEMVWLLLTTRSYQAKGFYLKHGFEVYGELADMPFTGVTTYYMAYRLTE